MRLASGICLVSWNRWRLARIALMFGIASHHGAGRPDSGDSKNLVNGHWVELLCRYSGILGLESPYLRLGSLYPTLQCSGLIV